MKTYKNQSDDLMVIVLKLLICGMLCLLGLKAGRAQVLSLPATEPLRSRQDIQSKVKQVYTSQVGVREKQPNSGPAVEKYLRYVNLPKGNPWCAAFVCWVLGQAGVDNPRSGWTPDLFRSNQVIWERGAAGTDPGTRSKEQGLPQNVPYAYPSSLVTCLPARQAGNSQLATEKDPRTKNQEPRLPQYAPSSLVRGNSQLATRNSQLTTRNSQLSTRNPQPLTGDVFGLYFPEKKRIAHVGFIDKWDGTWLVSVEGNTNVSGSREGDGVYRKRRLTRSIFKVARYVY